MSKVSFPPRGHHPHMIKPRMLRCYREFCITGPEIRICGNLEGGKVASVYYRSYAGEFEYGSNATLFGNLLEVNMNPNWRYPKRLKEVINYVKTEVNPK